MPISIIKTYLDRGICNEAEIDRNGNNNAISIYERFRNALNKIESRAIIESKADYFQLAKDLRLWDIPCQELVELYGSLKNWDNAGHSKELNAEIMKLAFEVRDRLVRLASNDASQRAEVGCLAAEYPELLKDFSRINPRQSVFIPLAKLKEAASRGGFQDNRPKSNGNSPRSLHVSVEYEKAMTGGVGGVAQSLLLKMNEAGHDARILTPFYDVYKGDDSFKGAKFVGFVEHELNGKMLKSSIYKVWGRGHAAHYVLKPDPSCVRLFDIMESKNVYSNIDQGSSLDERSIYLASAVAAMAGTYRGRKRQKQFDILHFHTWTPTLGAHVLKHKYSPLRAQAQLPAVHPVQHFHHGSLADQTIRSADVYKQLGLGDVPSTVKEANTQQDIWLHTDGVAFVSPTIAEKSIDPKTGEGLHKVARHLHRNGRLTSVMNGIDWKAHSITSAQAHGAFAVQQVSGANGRDITDYEGGKARIKKALFDAGLVPDPEKPLFLYVGRYSPEKGIDKLQGMAEEVIKNGGQCVIMGWGEGGHVPSGIKRLSKLVQKYPQAMRVYTAPKDQLELFQDSGASKGNLLRAASDFMLMPSRFEGCALVVWEALARGCLIISSMGGGLKAQCHDLKDAGEEKFNSFGYCNDFNAQRNAAGAIRRAVAFYNQKKQTPGQWNGIVGRVFRESQKNDWLIAGGPVEQITDFYKNVMKAPALGETLERQKLVEAYYKKYSKNSLRRKLSVVKHLAARVRKWSTNKIDALVKRVFKVLGGIFKASARQM